MHITVKVENLGVAHPNGQAGTSRDLLSGVCAHVKPGQIMAVMGPSGCGKTTFLSALSGRTKSTGRMLFNDGPMTKSIRRRICYVLQNDVFFSSLTLRQTLEFTADIRLPDTLSKSSKNLKIDQVLDALDLKSCEHTLVGDFMRPGLSGGQKKRCSIACELLSNPSIMLLDEPTSSLDSCTAQNLIKLLKQYAVREQKTVIVSIHQPSSQVFYMFDKLLLLSQGRMTYFGSIENTVPYFNRFDYHMQHVSYNPADFLLDVSKQLDEKELSKLSGEARRLYFDQSISNSVNQNSTYVSQPNSIHSQMNNKIIDKNKSQFVLTNKNNDHETTKLNLNQFCIDHKQQNYILEESNIHNSWSKIYIYDKTNDDDDSSNCDHDSSYINNQSWPSGFWTQVFALSKRNFIEGKSRFLSRLNWIQTIGMALISGFVWFQLPRTEETLNDVKGWIYYSTNFWMMWSLFCTITTIPQESQIINKERLAGMYRLSAYYTAKMIAELPLIIIMPSAFHMISYPMLGLYSIRTFLVMWVIVILNSLASQSVGLLIGFLFKNLDISVTVASLYTTSTMLFAGFYAENIPNWLSWFRYTSIVFYGCINMQIVELTTGPPISCASKNSKYASCNRRIETDHMMISKNLSQNQMLDNVNGTTFNLVQSMYIDENDIMTGLDPIKPNESPAPFWYNTLCLVMFLVVFRYLGYVVLRVLNKPS